MILPYVSIQIALVCIPFVAGATPITLAGRVFRSDVRFEVVLPDKALTTDGAATPILATVRWIVAP